MLFGLLVPSFSIVFGAWSALSFVGEGAEVLMSREARGLLGEVDILVVEVGRWWMKGV